MGNEAALAIAIDRANGGGATVALTGELDIVTAPEACDAIETLTLDGVTTIVVDLAGVRFIDSTGLGALVGMFKRCVVAGGDLVLQSPAQRPHAARDLGPDPGAAHPGAGGGARSRGGQLALSRLRYVDPHASRGPIRRALVRAGTSRPGRWFSRRVMWKLDPHVMRLTRGRVGMAFMLPTGVLETRGARTGKLRRNAVVYFHDDDRVTIVASKMGAAEHPAWFHNLVAHPDVVFADEQFRADVVEDDAERERLWRLADKVMPAYATYRKMAAQAGRTIPIVQLARR